MGSVETLLATGLVVLAAAVVQWAAGFGFALLTTSLLSLTEGAHDAVLLAVVLGMVGNISMAWTGRHVVDRDLLGGVLRWAPPGMVVGVLLYAYVADDTLQLLIAGAVAVTVVVLASGWRIPVGSRRSNAVTGVLAGALTTSTGTNGPPVVALLTARAVPAEVFRATAATTFLLLDVVAVPLLLLGTIRSTGSGESALGGWTLPVCVVALVLGALVGTRCRALLTPDRFRRLVLVLLSCSAVTAAVAALTG